MGIANSVPESLPDAVLTNSGQHPPLLTAARCLPTEQQQPAAEPQCPGPVLTSSSQHPPLPTAAAAAAAAHGPPTEQQQQQQHQPAAEPQCPGPVLTSSCQHLPVLPAPAAAAAAHGLPTKQQPQQQQQPPQKQLCVQRSREALRLVIVSQNMNAEVVLPFLELLQGCSSGLDSQLRGLRTRCGPAAHAAVVCGGASPQEVVAARTALLACRPQLQAALLEELGPVQWMAYHFNDRSGALVAWGTVVLGLSSTWAQFQQRKYGYLPAPTWPDLQRLLPGLPARSQFATGTNTALMP